MTQLAFDGMPTAPERARFVSLAAVPRPPRGLRLSLPTMSYDRAVRAVWLPHEVDLARRLVEGLAEDPRAAVWPWAVVDDDLRLDLRLDLLLEPYLDRYTERTADAEPPRRPAPSTRRRPKGA